MRVCVCVGSHVKVDLEMLEKETILCREGVLEGQQYVLEILKPPALPIPPGRAFQDCPVIDFYWATFIIVCMSFSMGAEGGRRMSRYFTLNKQKFFCGSPSLSLTFIKQLTLCHLQNVTAKCVIEGQAFTNV